MPVTRKASRPVSSASGVGAGELVPHMPAHSDTEKPGFLRGQRNLIRPDGKPAGLHRHNVLPEILTIQASHDAVGQERGIHMTVHDRFPVDADPGGWLAVPGKFSTWRISGRDGTGTLTNTSLALIDRRYRP
jgi:hypothetical protein